jgi:hypothetical protein
MARGVAGVALVLLAAPLFALEPSAPRLTSLEAALDRIFRVVQTSPGVEQVSDLLPSSVSPGEQAGAMLHTGEATYDSPHILMVRVKDGKPVLGCVDSREAAERFLKAPAEKLGGRTAAAEEK